MSAMDADGETAQGGKVLGAVAGVDGGAILIPSPCQQATYHSVWPIFGNAPR